MAAQQPQQNGAVEQEEKGILCVGMICLNMINSVPKYPSEDSDTTTSQFDWDIGGNAIHTVMILRQLDARSSFVGAIAADSSLPFFAQKLEALDISIQHCPVRTNQAMAVAVVIKSEATHSRTLIYSDQKMKEMTFEEFKQFVEKELLLDQVGWVHFDGRNVEETEKMINYVKERKTKEKLDITISLDVEQACPKVETLFNKPDILFISKNYAKVKGYANMNAAVKTISKAAWMGAKVICPWAEKGACGILAGGSFRDIWTVPAFPPEKIVDPLGAGAAFNAGTIFALSKGKPIDKAMRFGSKLAGFKCGQKGFTLEELEG